MQYYLREVLAGRHPEFISYLVVLFFMTLVMCFITLFFFAAIKWLLGRLQWNRKRKIIADLGQTSNINPFSLGQVLDRLRTNYFDYYKEQSAEPTNTTEQHECWQCSFLERKGTFVKEAELQQITADFKIEILGVYTMPDWSDHGRFYLFRCPKCKQLWVDFIKPNKPKLKCPCGRRIAV